MKKIALVTTTLCLPVFMLILPFLPTSGENFGIGYLFFVFFAVAPIILAFIPVTISYKVMSISVTFVLYNVAGFISFPETFKEDGWVEVSVYSVYEMLLPYIGLFAVGLIIRRSFKVFKRKSNTILNTDV